jgi:diketogulonate reductase-like aldo/keto reductase
LRISRFLAPYCWHHRCAAKHVSFCCSPLGGDNNLVIRDRTLVQIGAAHNCSAAAVALAWVISNGNVIAIPESGVSAHVKENAVALSLTLTPQEIQILDTAYPGPSGAN